MTKAAIFQPIALVVTALVALTPSMLGDCKCRPASKKDTTRWGGNMAIVEREKDSYRKIEGIVQMGDGSPLENALVEIFDQPDYLLKSGADAKPPQQHRKAACFTSADGKFCFRHLPDGKYELRSSIGNCWNVTHIYVVVDRKARQTEELAVGMQVGT